MKSIKTKLRCCLAVLLLGLLSFTSIRAQTVLPTDQQVEEVLNTPDARALHSYLLSQGYTDGGIIPGSQGVYTEGSTSTPTNTPSFRPARPETTIVVVVVVVVVAKRYTNLTGQVYEATYALEKLSDGRNTVDATAENQTSQLVVTGGVVRSLAKFSLGSLITRFDNCWQQFGAAALPNCINCYNCLRGCIVNTWPRWKKILCCFGCIPSCFRCVTGIISFTKCVLG